MPCGKWRAARWSNGMVFTSKGSPFFDEFGASRLGSIDPSTMRIAGHVLPNPATRPRRIAITPDDIIWYTDYSRGGSGANGRSYRGSGANSRHEQTLPVAPCGLQASSTAFQTSGTTRP